MKRLRKKRVLLGLMLLAVMHSSISWGFDFNDLLEFKLPDSFYGFFEPQFSIRLFNSVALDSEMVIKTLKKYQPGYNNEKLVTTGYAFPFATLAREINLKKPGMVKIGLKGVEYDQIGSLVFTKNEGSGVNHLEFIGKKHSADYEDFQYIIEHAFVINVDETFIKKHSVRVHKFGELDWANVPDDLLPKVEAHLYPQMKLGQLDFVNKKASAATLRRRLGENFNFKVRCVFTLAKPKVLIASFEPKVDKGVATYNKFSCLMINGKVAKYGYFTDFIVFGIDKRIYMQCLNEVAPGSGNIGKVLYTLDGGNLNLVQQDYSYGD